MIGLGPHTMTVVALQGGLITLAVLAVWWAARLRPEGRR